MLPVRSPAVRRAAPSTLPGLPRASSPRAQRGIALWWLAMVAVLVILGLTYGSRIVGPYYRHYVMTKAVHEVLVEAQQENLSSADVKDRIFKRFQINDLNVAYDDLDVEGEGNAMVVDIDNPVRVPLYGSATLDLDLSVHQGIADLPAAP